MAQQWLQNEINIHLWACKSNHYKYDFDSINRPLTNQIIDNLWLTVKFCLAENNKKQLRLFRLLLGFMKKADIKISIYSHTH